MKLFKINIWDFVGKADAICITTNGFVKSGGEAVMGRGCAMEATQRFNGIAKILGNKLNSIGNVPHILWNNPIIVSFPVKPSRKVCTNVQNDVVTHMRNKFVVGSVIPGWACKADIEIIKESAMLLAKLAEINKWNTIALPMAGCGAGELTWVEVEPILNQYLDDRFFCVTP